MNKEYLFGIKCKKCQINTKHQKQLSILRFPKFLIVSFKRYSTTNKINTSGILPLKIELGEKIQSDVQDEISKSQKEYY